MTSIVELHHTIRFEAAHHLPKVPAAHKCRRLHGHSFEAVITVRGPVDPASGWLMDYAEIKRVVHPVRDRLDHFYLNDVPGLENPTSENIAIWLWDALLPDLPTLYGVRIAETCNNACSYRGPVATAPSPPRSG